MTANDRVGPIPVRCCLGFLFLGKDQSTLLPSVLRYCSVEEFAADAHLVFNNCELFNEDTSDVGKAGHAMRLFFESRWSEFYQTKDKEKDK